MLHAEGRGGGRQVVVYEYIENNYTVFTYSLASFVSPDLPLPVPLMLGLIPLNLGEIMGGEVE